MANILLLDDLNPIGAEILEKAGHTVTSSGPLNGDNLIKALSDKQAVAVRSASKLTREIIEKCPDLKLIGRAGVGTDNIDKVASAERQVKVINAPLANTNSAAEHALALMMSLARKIPLADRLMRQNEWPKKLCTGIEFPGKTLGVVGAGNVGRRVIQVSQALGMKVIVSDVMLSAEKAKELNVTLVDIDTLVKTADILTFHVPLTPETNHMINAERLAQMKPTALVINCSRGGVIDETALYEALKSKTIGGAAVDVFENEPLKDSPLTELDNVILTPHLGAATGEAQITAAKDIADQFEEYFENGNLRHPVN